MVLSILTVVIVMAVLAIALVAGPVRRVSLLEERISANRRRNRSRWVERQLSNRLEARVREKAESLDTSLRDLITQLTQAHSHNKQTS